LGGLRVLPWARSGCDVVAGVPDRVRALADELDAVARGLVLMGDLVREVPSADWGGPAALAFGGRQRAQPARYRAAAECLGSAASAVRGHAAVLEVAQQESDDAVRLDLLAARATLTWLRAGAGEMRLVGSASDPGAASRLRVTSLVGSAQARVLVSATSTAGCLRAAASRAPDRPGRAVRGWDSLTGFVRDVDQGARESGVQAVALALRLDPNRAVRQPGVYWSDLSADGASLGRLAAHPGELVHALTDAETFEENRGRWLGHLLPDVALALGTAGAAPIAGRTATATFRATARLAPRSLKQPMADALVAQVGTGRSALRLRDVRTHLTAADVAGHRTAVAPLDHAVGRRLARDAEWAERHLTPRLREVTHELRTSVGAGHTDVELRGLDHALKGEDSLLRKLSTESHQRGVPGPLLATTLNDTVRYTITLPDDAYTAGAVDAVTAMERRGLRLTAAKNFWGGERYQGLNLTFHDSLTGRPIELQLHTPESWQATVDTHVDYEWLRSAGVPARLKEFFARRIADRFAPVPRPHGVESLGTLLVPTGGPARLTAPELRSVLGADRVARLSTGVHSGRCLAYGDDE
jgi:hypothetical protein